LISSPKCSILNLATIASIGSIIPGPIGMISSGVAAASYAAAGDKKNAVLMATCIAASAVGAGGAVVAFKAAKGVGTAVKTVQATRVGSILTRGGAEVKIGSRLRISPLGNSGAVGSGGVGKNWAATLPHIHYKSVGAPAKVMKLHRPWQTTFRKWF
jgi:hypothetical protein